MTKPEVVRFGDGHYRRVIYGLGPYIADYEEQVLLVYSALLVSKVFDVSTRSRISNNGPVDDLKVLMKVYLPAIEGHVPMDVVRTFRAFLEFCYLVWRNIIMESTLVQIQDALNQFHHYRKIFESTGVVLTFSLPRQHSYSHYILLIQLFGAPNGLCSSITETKHIKAIKEPWRHSSRYKALGQMLVTNQRLDKLAASRIDFKSRRMLNGTCLSEMLRALKRLRLNTEPHANQPDQPNESSILLLPNPDITIQGDNEEGEVIDGPTLVQAHVQLAKTPHKPAYI
ncbi:hypothetical protein DFJ58DRAFT_846544 [Suillus subalutaceus]|uniref:uncharacterized protein n=1 Tax=Suillus subalutaceus TaxID=48586 RepID=UPI001B86B162|nr:uncharacterized protein DFJ58DRAFT_846544 [Suillus subalutaceus]KAG1837337.1 hypothetical protein DFJ58DRAFT_846544 [Suillus subalutaceus]